MKVWIDGRVVDGSEARVPVSDHGLLYGDGVFEGIRIYGRRVFRLDDHLQRYAASAKAIALELPGGIEAVREIVLETARAFDADEAYVRLLATRGEGALDIDPTHCSTPRLICIVDRIVIYPEQKRLAGLDLLTSSWRRPPADVLDPRVKSLNYLNNVMAILEAKQRGGDEALLLNAAGTIAETSVTNIFAVRDGDLLTPPATDGALEGITRATVLEIAASLEIPAREQSLGRFDLFAADEVFLTGSGAALVPVRSLDGRSIGAAGPGPVYEKIRSVFLETAAGRGTPF
ncbi:MAG: branched-chain-amino-acid transaminase [Deltaproteobacteria bacterium]|nr:branched-chain-amino-acid transaminase [Deltaproteobacteria bacterium]MBW2694796.1 branched-chain-amino-acid transaminase [Deltaproteobacteria bacterium]